jgi:hypothetical protein
MHPGSSYRRTMSGTSGDFSLQDLHAALDARRAERGLAWVAVAREVSRRFADGTARSVSSSTITGVRTRAVAEADGVLQMLLWLDRSPESFVRGHPLTDAPAARLADPGDGHVLRVDTAALHAALDQRRSEDQGLTWAKVASTIGCGPTTLTGLAAGGRTNFPAVTRMTTWLGRPLAAFTHATPW